MTLPFDLNLSELEVVRQIATESLVEEVQELFGNEGIDLISNISPGLVRHIASALEMVLAERETEQA